MKKTHSLIGSIILSLSYFLTLCSLLVMQINSEPYCYRFHSIAGFLLLFCSTIHMLKHLAWFKSVFFRTPDKLSKTILQRRRTVLWMMITGLICIMSAAKVQTSQMLFPFASRLHAISGISLIILMGVHMVQHWSWLAATLKQFRQLRLKDTSQVVYFENRNEP